MALGIQEECGGAMHLTGHVNQVIYKRSPQLNNILKP